MCTVTFIPFSKSDFILTSNRDEAPGRETLLPDLYIEEEVEIIYPKDKVAGGTWIGMGERKRVVSLMNGGFEPHRRKPSYARSRGLITKDLLTTSDILKYLSETDFSEIEPFTVIAVDWNESLKLLEIVWTGEEMHVLEKPLEPKIWSSSPLYPKEWREQREDWFKEFLSSEKDTSSEKILDFHKIGGEGNKEYQLVMDRGFVRTKSITQIIKKGKRLNMIYYDLQSGDNGKIDFEIKD